MKNTATLYYVHDPMCSWCFAFRPTWAELQKQLPESIKLQYVLGGLAPDSDAPMPQDTRQMIQGAWRQIEQTVPGTQFNFDFWSKCTPRRSTYPSCRAVLLARESDPTLEAPMTEAIQQAYYQQAKNPSDDETLVALAVELGLDGDKFATALKDSSTQARLKEELSFARSIGGNSFPSLILKLDKQRYNVPIDYNNSKSMLSALQSVVS